MKPSHKQWTEFRENKAKEFDWRLRAVVALGLSTLCLIAVILYLAMKL
jgi:hypothetical protein